MKKNVPKFLIARNEAASPDSTYIVHTQEPAFIAELKKFSDISERDSFISENEGIELILVNAVMVIEIKRYLESPDREKNKSYLNKKIVHWVVANLIVPQ